MKQQNWHPKGRRWDVFRASGDGRVIATLGGFSKQLQVPKKTHNFWCQTVDFFGAAILFSEKQSDLMLREQRMKNAIDIMF